MKITLDPSSTPDPQRPVPLPRLAAVAAQAKSLFGLAVEHQMARRLDRAEMAYRRVLRLDPFDIEAHSNLGAILCQRGEIEEAQRHFARAMGQQPRSRATDRVQSVA